MFLAFLLTALFETASAQLASSVPCLAIRPPAAHIAHVAGDEFVAIREVILLAEIDLEDSSVSPGIYDGTLSR